MNFNYLQLLFIIIIYHFCSKFQERKKIKKKKRIVTQRIQIFLSPGLIFFPFHSSTSSSSFAPIPYSFRHQHKQPPSLRNISTDFLFELLRIFFFFFHPFVSFFLQREIRECYCSLLLIIHMKKLHRYLRTTTRLS